MTVAIGRISIAELLTGIGRSWPEISERLFPEVLRIYRAQQYLYADLCAVLQPYGLQPADFDVLAALRTQGTPYELTPTVLYRALFLSSGGLTKILKRLEQSGLIERPAHPEDRRSLLVRLSPTGLERVEAAAIDVLAHQEAFLAPLSTAERSALGGLLAKLLQPLEQSAGRHGG